MYDSKEERSESQVQQAGAIGAVVMNAPVSWYDDFEIVDAEDKDEYNV